MDYAQRSGNPYDFRSPVRHSALLAGRDKELSQIDELLRESTLGRPVHISLLGGQGSGKSSLLNGVMDLAADRGFLSAKMVLREATVQTEFDFYKALYDSALSALLENERLLEDDEVMHDWLARTCAGDLTYDSRSGYNSTLEFGLVIAARLNNRIAEVVSTPMIERDLKRMLSMGGEPLQGLVLCLDQAELLDDNNDLAPSLIQLTECTPLLTIITAAETAGTLQAAVPRAWAHIDVGPFQGANPILDAITKPIKHVDDTLGASPPSLTTAMDIRELTGGVPYEVNLVCHFIWDAIQQGEQDSFELSSTVIERVRAELENKSRHQADSDIEVFSSLSTSDYQLLVDLAPYEALTIHELALVRLMLSDYARRELEETEDAIRRDLRYLADIGVVRTENERFELVGNPDSRIYLRYAAQRHTGRKLSYGHTYHHAVTMAFVSHLGNAIVSEKYNDALIFRSSRPQELGMTTVGDWLKTVSDAVTNGDIVTLSEYFGVWLAQHSALRQEDCSFIVIAMHMQVGLHHIEHTDVLANMDGMSTDELRELAAHWTNDCEELLNKYEAKVIECACYELSHDTLCTATVYGHLRLISSASYVLYLTGATRAADELLASAIEASDQMIGTDPTDPLIRTMLADAWHRHGFIAATHKEWDTARKRLERSRQMFATNEWLLEYNEAYIAAEEGDLLGALAHAATALRGYRDPPDRLLIHAYLPTEASWSPPNDQWNVVELHGRWIYRFLELQMLVLQAVEGDPANVQRLESTVGELSNSVPPPLLRLAGWAQLTILRNPNTAADLFRQAVAATPYDEAGLPRLEAIYAEEVSLIAS